MWELFSLGSDPYTGMEANQNLFLKICDGYRLEKPEYSTNGIYSFMLSCWNVDPEKRPLFQELGEKLGQILTESVRNVS